jgi:bifunctional non-homologous end joining protein LigD
VTHDQTQPFAQTLAQELEREHSDLTVSAMAKTVRRKRVVIDWSQNSDFKTTVGVYSLRVKRSIPYVSRPVRWEELRDAFEGGDRDRLYFQPPAALDR